MSKYISEFKSINDINYKIEITTQSGSSTKNFTLGGNPFTTSMKSDGKTMYAPVKCSGGTIEMLVKDLPLDIYTSDNQGVKVVLTNTTTNNVEWTGYVTPSSYSQDFNHETEVLQIDCVDGIASLKDVPFRPGTISNETFLNIIFKILKVANCYRYLYITNNILMTSSDTTSIMSKLMVNEANFFEEKDYEAQPEDEVADSCYNVLYDLMLYMGYTIIPYGEDVYILDYDAIRTSKNTFYRYSLSGTTIGSPTNVTLSHTHQITNSSYGEGGTDFSLSEVFNQCIVVDDFNKMDSGMEGLNNDKNLTNITASVDTTLKNWFRNDSRFYESEVFTAKNKEGKDESFFITIMKDYDEDTKKTSHNIFFVLGKIYKHDLIETIHYTSTNSRTSVTVDKFSQLQDYKGATFVGYFTKKIESKTYNEWRAGITSNWDGQSMDVKLQQFGKLCNLSNIGNKKLVNYVVCLNQTTNHIEHDQTTRYPYFTMRKDIPAVFGGDGGYIILKGTVVRHDMSKAPFPMNGDCWCHKDETDSSIYKSEGYFWSQLKWGNYYWYCEGNYADMGEWKTTPSYFKIFYGDPTKEMKVKDFQDKDLKFYNNSGSLWGVDEDGYYIPTPPNTNLTGNIEWTIYANKDTYGKWARNNKADKKNSYNGHKPRVMMYKGLDLTFGFSDDALNSEAAKSDTVYTNNVSGYSKVSPMEEIKFKVCTFDNKTASKSVVTYMSGTNSLNLDTTYNQATRMTLRQEEHFVVRNVSQYQNPRVELDMTLKNSLNIKPWTLLTYNMISGKSFIIDEMNIDYKFNKIKMNIIEKTNDYN